MVLIQLLEQQGRPADVGLCSRTALQLCGGGWSRNGATRCPRCAVKTTTHPASLGTYCTACLLVNPGIPALCK